VLLWIDTWSNHFKPSVAMAAAEVLESAGFRVLVSERSLCCGRPLYDYGMLDLAKRLLRDVLEQLRPTLRAGIPVVGLEPSCVSVFRDELPSLFPDDGDAQHLKAQTFMLGDFLLQQARSFEPPRLQRNAIVQGHCHHKAVLGFENDLPLYQKLGISADAIDAGCCGMAGAFGYEAAHHAVSVACAEQKLVPAVRNAPPETLIIADGFSCRSQIEQQTQRRALHTAEVLQMALSQGRAPHASVERLELRQKKARNLALLVFGAALVLGAAGRLIG
jgi:Fe-S oxidoreductase